MAEPSAGWRQARSGVLLGVMLLPMLFAARAGQLSSQCFWLCVYCSLHVSLRASGTNFVSVVLPLALVPCTNGMQMDIFVVVPLVVCMITVYSCERIVPRTFTLGEATIVGHVWALLYMAMLMFVYGQLSLTKLRKVILIGIFAPSTYAAGVIMLAHFRTAKSLTMHVIYYTSGALAIVLMFVWMSMAIGENSLAWLADYMTQRTMVPVKLTCYWVIVLTLGLGVFLPKLVPRLPRIVIRKYFHLMLLLVVVPAILLHLRFTSLVLAVVFSIFVVLESLRVARVAPLAAALDEYFGSFRDDRDQGTLVVTHIYLLLGCAISVWYAQLTYGGTYSATGLLVAYSGLTCTGLADGAAAVVGTSFGRTRWFGKKTLEGSAAFAVTAFGFQAVLLWYQGFQGLSLTSWAMLALADLMACLLEATSEQIDNIVLPLFHMCWLQLV
eukprot:TRINITY_DN39776_c0_g1_i1.p1 TRINITY_DN39776_c0_g1~~TRINITY_DN39776_c0_g1_i1.p1  ORF type:complete len:491 (+),score=41.17 TRINITY_DN39776_c0_g1_i1:156-1475(+)